MSGAGGDAALAAAGDAGDMSQVVTGPARADAPAHPLPRRHGLLGDLDRPGDVFARLGPNWFASVMGTGIVATAAATLPVQWPGVRGFATAVWVLSAVWLITLTGAEVVLWTRHRDAARAHACDPVMVQFYGAPPMTLLTVGAGTLLLGPPLIGARRDRHRRGAVVPGHDHRPGRQRGGALSHVHQVASGPRRRVRRVADAGGPAHGQRVHRRAAPPPPAGRAAQAAEAERLDDR